MPPVPLLTPREAVSAFRPLGWDVARQRRSHIILAGWMATRRRRVAPMRAFLDRLGGIGTEATTTAAQPRVEQISHRVAEHV